MNEVRNKLSAIMCFLFLMMWVVPGASLAASNQAGRKKSATKVPAAVERAGFMSLLSAVQSFASTAGAFLAAQILTSGPDGRLVHMDAVALLSIDLGLLIPVLMLVVERSVRRQTAALKT